MVTVLNPLGVMPTVAANAVNSMPEMGQAHIVVLDNSKHNFRMLMDLVTAEIERDYPAIKLEFIRKPGAAHPMAEDVRERIKQSANLVLTGSGD